ncbi:MAG: alpha/beta hydrolase [Gammaproteobacteria bacterium]
MAVAFDRRAVGFAVQGDRVRGDFYLPAGSRKPPVVVMAHGFGGERRFSLPAFAEFFAAHGLAVLLFDYRGFGDSEGQPRALVDHHRHLEDYAAAVAWARQCPEVDGLRLAVWGTSYSGGHALVTAARDPGVKAVVAQVPHVDGLASALGYPKRLLPKASWLAAQDMLATARGAEPVRMPIVAEEGVRALAMADCYDGYTRMIPAGADWMNAVPARILFTLMTYRPVTEVARIACPVLMVASPTDTLIPFSATRRAAAQIRDCRLELITGGHFDPYVGDCFERVVRMEGDFLCRTLGVAA